MARNFDGSRKELVDFDHYSDLGNAERTALDRMGVQLPSEAAGWISAVEPRADGLWGLIEWTRAGAAALANQTYRFLSPVFSMGSCETVGAGKVRPTVLLKAGLTNEPNIRALPALANRDAAKSFTGPLVAVLANRDLNNAPADSGDTMPGKPGGKESTIMDYKAELLAVLELLAEATDEEIAAALAVRKQCADELENARKERDALKNRAETAEGRLAQLDQAAREKQADADLETHAAVIKNRDEVRLQLLANREGTLKLLASLQPPTGSQEPLRNRRETADPESPEQKLENRRQEREAFVAETKKECRCATVAQAWDIARNRKPELFR